jgi:beta-glucosidase
MEGGAAIADVLFGEVTPSGKLPITYPRFVNALTTYDHKASEEPGPVASPTLGYQPQFEFGFGLSYTTFAYANLSVTPASPARTDPVAVSVSLKNTGPRAGAEVVQLFVSQHAASVTPPVRRLKRFVKVTLQPGETRDVRFRLAPDDFSFLGADGKRTIEPGVFTVVVGGLRQDLSLR